MSSSNGVIRIGRKGIVKFAFGDDGEPFEVDVVVAFQEWVRIDESFRIEEGLANEGTIPTERKADYHQAAVEFVTHLSGNVLSIGSSNATITTAEALDFIARLREQYDELVTFFRPRSRDVRDSPASSEAELRFSVEGEEK